MKKEVVILTVLALFVSVSAFAQGDPSAKFAAVYSDDVLLAATEAQSCDIGEGDPDQAFDFDTQSGVLLATMKMPSGKEILTGVSGESGILLVSNVKGKNGGSGTSLGWGRVSVKIKAVNVDTGEIYFPVPDGRIVLNARAQVLNATLGGVIESCEDGDGDGVINVATECVVTDEEIGLLTWNRSANHFNVVFKDLPQGTYEVRARFRVTSVSWADASVDACAYAGSIVVLGDRIVTLQDVRAIKGGVVEF
jgi:hypothetical protein